MIKCPECGSSMELIVDEDISYWKCINEECRTEQDVGEENE